MVYLLFFYTHYTVRGGYSNVGVYCGALFISARTNPGSTNWVIGAALSLLHIILFVVVLLLVVPIVVCFLLLLAIVLVASFGTVALLYQCTHYACRGGRSSSGTYCGVFCVDARNVASIASWDMGAALE